MLIREFTESPEHLKDVDLKDDLQHFMIHDPKFYRRDMYPLIAKVRDHIKDGNRCKETVFRGVVDKAAEIYCNKFDIPGGHKSVFTDTDRDEIARKIFGQERDNIEKGHYDGEPQ